MFLTTYSVTYCIYVPGKLGFFSLLLCSLWWVQIGGFVLDCRSNWFFVQYNISLSSLCKLIWRHWTYKIPVRYILSSVWVRLSIFSQISIIQYVGLCVLSLPISLVMIERIYILCVIIIIIISEVWTITHCLGLGHETMVCAVCLSIFLYIYIYIYIYIYKLIVAWWGPYVVTELGYHWFRYGLVACSTKPSLEPRSTYFKFTPLGTCTALWADACLWWSWPSASLNKLTNVFIQMKTLRSSKCWSYFPGLKRLIWNDAEMAWAIWRPFESRDVYCFITSPKASSCFVQLLFCRCVEFYFGYYEHKRYEWT